MSGPIALSLLIAAAGATTPTSLGADGQTTPEIEQTDPHRVVGGAPSAEGAWPDAAAIWFGREVGCTGVLIAPDVVLTAGHCAGGITHVTLGAADYDAAGPGAEKIAVAETIAYPDWERTLDLALLILAEESAIQPRTIAQGCLIDEALDDGARVTIAGYGATNAWGTKYGTTLQEAATQVVDADCTDPGYGCLSKVSPGGELRAGGDGVDACFGDSGGPLYLEVSQTSRRMDYGLNSTEDGDRLDAETETAAYLVGITSRGYDYSLQPCSQGGIYARPDAALDWIEERAGIELDAPSCEELVDPVAASLTESHLVSTCGLQTGAGGAAILLSGLLGLRRRQR